MQYLKFLVTLLALASLNSLLCWIAISVGELYPILSLVLFPFGILGILMIVETL